MTDMNRKRATTQYIAIPSWSVSRAELLINSLTALDKTTSAKSDLHKIILL